MTTFLIAVFILYYILVLTLAFGWARLGDQSVKNGAQKDRFISVVIAFRNEELHLPVLLEGIRKQSYARSRYEVILVNDHSTDHSTEGIENQTSSQIKLIHLPMDLSGKKTALDFGISHAQGELIATTDADCRLLPGWLSTINEQFHHDEVKMVTGLVRIDESTSLFSRLQALEFVSLMGTTGATIGLGSPAMCNGANLAFLKSAYHEVNGYEGNKDIPSGDDEFLMRKILKKWKNSIRFMDNEQAIVATSGQSSFSDWVNQRLRWAGKWKYNSSLSTKAIALAILGFHIFFLLFFVFVLSAQFNVRQASILWGTKMFVEAVFLLPVCTTLKLRWRWISFFALQFSYSIYVLMIGILSQVKGYEWKGRRWNPQ